MRAKRSTPLTGAACIGPRSPGSARSPSRSCAIRRRRASSGSGGSPSTRACASTAWASRSRRAAAAPSRTWARRSSAIAIGLARVLLFTRWLDGAVTLTRWLAAQPGPPEPRLLASLASQLAAAARLGLVHRRHSSNNLLVVMQHGEPAPLHDRFSVREPRARPRLCPASPATWRASRAGSCASRSGRARACRPSSRRWPPRCAHRRRPARISPRASASELEAVIRDPSARRELAA